MEEELVHTNSTQGCYWVGLKLETLHGKNNSTPAQTNPLSTPLFHTTYITLRSHTFQYNLINHLPKSHPFVLYMPFPYSMDHTWEVSQKYP